MKGKVSVFSNGKLISVGTKSEKEARADILIACNVLAEGGVKIPSRLKVRVQNIVATGELGKPIAIEELASRLPNAIYEPEQFPGAMYHAEELEGASVLVFANGKVVFAGLKNRRLLEAARHTLERLVQYS
jgi:transcription initiation factor TFIID TATA-box-binding protein